MTRAALILLLSLLSLAPVVAVAIESVTAFGTDNGYDVGGDDSLCFVSILPKQNGTSYSSIDVLNADLFASKERVTLLPKVRHSTHRLKFKLIVLLFERTVSLLSMIVSI